MQTEEGEIHSHIMQLEEKNELLSAQEAAIKAEIARAKREEEERKREKRQLKQRLKQQLQSKS